MNWENYEDIVKVIYERLGSHAGVKILCHGRNCKVVGKSGVEHQIDVLAEHSDGWQDYRTAVECKYWDRKRPKDDVTKLAEILEDAQIDKGVIVSKLGFTSDAITFARYKNIELVELREPTDEDWEGRMKNITIEIIVPVPQVLDFRMKITEQDADSVGILPVELDAIEIIEPNDTSRRLSEIVYEMVCSADKASVDLQEFHKDFPSGTIASGLRDESETKIVSIDFKIKFEQIKKLVEIRGDDHVAMIMKSLFSNRTHIISPRGDIRES